MPAHLEGICRSVYGVCQQLQQVFPPHLAMLLLVVPILPHCLVSKNTFLSSCDDWTTPIPLIIRAPNPNNQGFLRDLLMLKRSPGPRVCDAPSSTKRLPKKSPSVFRLPAIVTPQRRSLLDGTVLSNRRNGYRGCKRTTKFGLLSRAHVAPL